MVQETCFFGLADKASYSKALVTSYHETEETSYHEVEETFRLRLVDAMVVTRLMIHF